MMPLFGRKTKKTSGVRIGNTGGVNLLVQTPVGVQPLQAILDYLWEHIAAEAWDGYQRMGRGLVLFDPQNGDLVYVPVYQVSEILKAEEAVAQCQTYDPAAQVVFVTEIVHARGFRRDPMTAGVTISMPDAGLSPLAAYEWRQLTGGA